MKPTKCVACTKVKGKRVCQINGGALICPRCCAEIRNPDCEGCFYYSQAEQYRAEKAQEKAWKPGGEHFIARIDPEVDEAVDQALAMMEGGNIRKGEAIITKLFKKNPDLYTVNYAMGMICLLKEQTEKGIAHLDKAIEIFPYFTQAWYNKAMAFQKILDVKNMLKALQKVVELGAPRDDFVQDAKVRLRDFEKSIHEDIGISLDTYIRSHEKFDDAFAKMQAEQWEQAIAGFEEVIAINPKSPQAYGNMGACLGVLGHREEALAALDKALEIDPSYEPAMVNRMAVEALKEGERLQTKNYAPVEYSKDYQMEKKSLLKELFGKFTA